MFDNLELIGIAAGIGTAFAWSISNMVHSFAAQIMGVQPFMMIRQPFAAVVLGIACLLMGEIQLYEMKPLHMAILSGVVGIAISDWCVYESILRIGIRASLVCLSLNASFTALMSWIFLHEYLGLQAFAGIAIATLGVIMVIIAEQKDVHNHLNPTKKISGLILAFVAAITLAIGMASSKEALLCGMPPLFLAFLRNLAASVVLWICGLFLQKIKQAIKSPIQNHRIIKYLLIGCLFGPAGGIWISCIAIQHLPAGVAATLIGLQPVVIMMISGLWERRCPSAVSILGACIACLGATILVLRP